jgi:hypothetical protein
MDLHIRNNNIYFKLDLHKQCVLSWGGAALEAAAVFYNYNYKIVGKLCGATLVPQSGPHK